MQALRTLFLSLAAGGATAAETAAPAAAPAVSSGATLMSFLFGLTVVILAIFGAAWLYRRVGRLPGALSGNLRILGGLALGARERLVLVQVGEQQLLLGLAPGVLRTLHVLDQPLPVAPEAALSGPAFAERLQKLMERRP